VSGTLDALEARFGIPIIFASGPRVGRGKVCKLVIEAFHVLVSGFLALGLLCIVEVETEIRKDRILAELI
jgi:hypothetical protein